MYPLLSSSKAAAHLSKEFIRQQKGRNPQITFYHKTISLKEVVGKTEMGSYNVGGRHPQDLGFRDKGEFQRLLDRHMVESNFIPQVGYEPQVSNDLMPKFNHWKDSLKYGKIVPLPVQIEMFADPKYFGCGAIPGEFANRYDHNAMGDYTRRWNRILRHDIGRGAAPKCDELGWVDIESFVLNDFSWPREDNMMIHSGRGARVDESAVGRRRQKLLEGYRHSMSPKAKKKRMLVVALYITPDELEEMWEHEDKDVFTEQVLRQCRWVGQTDCTPCYVRAFVPRTKQETPDGQHRLQEPQHALYEGDRSSSRRWLPCDVSEEPIVHCNTRPDARRQRRNT